MIARRRVVLALALGALALPGCTDPEPEVQTPGKPVVVTPVFAMDLEERIEASGELLAKQRADFAAQVAGEITEVLVEEGAAVEEGAVMLEIDPERRLLELDRARARVGEAAAAVAEQEREVKRMRALANQGVASATKLDQAETALQTARSRLAAARADRGVADRALRDASVRARFAGLVAQRYVDRGEFVREGDPLIDLVTLDPVEVEFHLPEADAARVSVGLPIEVTVTAYPDDVFDAVVSVVSPTIDPRTRTLRVRAVIENPDGRLRPGFFARANLGVASRENVLMVPEEAVLQRADGAVVFRVGDDARVSRIVVETGIVRDAMV
jgi:RND family efflux transporter MFP subunit